ncbi:hypothetical protein B0H12DRAFT_1118589 [Mycena haematopus]|nr:hypothetical protein B0H12DRAFT_1118589 [Mycena haematopus]
MSATEAPVILGRICSSWRTISLSTPRLWSQLHIQQPQSFGNGAPGLHEAKVAQRLEVVDAWLKRSGNCPLSISLDCETARYYPTYTPETDQFLTLLISHISRWQNIHLSIPSLAVERLSHLTENDVPLLKDLELYLHPSQINDIPKWAPSPSGILHAPNLSRFSIKGSILKASNLPLRWNQLTDLDLMGPLVDTGYPQTSSFLVLQRNAQHISPSTSCSFRSST